MKKFLMILCAVMMVFGMVGSASAIPYLDMNALESVEMDETSHPSQTWFFDLVDDVFVYGDVNTGDFINTARLYVEITDDDGNSCFDLELERADFYVDGDMIFNDIEVNSGLFSLNVISWVSDYMLYVTIDDVEGDFLVNRMAVGGDYTPVPEPSTILLLGSGLLGLVGYNRKRFSKKS